MAIKDYEFWFIVGTQHLYGEEIFADIIHMRRICSTNGAKSFLARLSPSHVLKHQVKY